MTDTHTHLYLPEFSLENQIPESLTGQCEAVDRALAAGVGRMIFPNVDRSTVQPMMALHTMRPDCTYVAMGLHPTEVNERYSEELDYISGLLIENTTAFVAVGEVGIDLYWDKTFEKEQMIVFEKQLMIADALSLPVIIHSREALPQILEVLKPYSHISVVFHSFGGTVADIESIRAVTDAYFGINGIVTFKNSRLADVLPVIGLDRILTETDSPYLAPVPYRGRRNESAYIPAIVDRIAVAMSTSVEDVRLATNNNATEFFNLN